MENKLDELENKFDDWLQTIYNVLLVPMPKIEKALNAGMVDGHTLDDYKSIVRSAINDHLSKTNPHELTLSQLGTLDQDELYRLLSLHQNKFNIPLTLIQNMNGKFSINWTSNKITVSQTTPTILGSKITVPSQVLDIASTQTQYLILNVTMGNKDFTGSYSISNNPTVSWTKIPVVRINRSNNTAQSRVIARIGENELSTEVRGTTLPVSGGLSQAKTGTIGNSWFT